jgi:hypothetical protein
MTTAVLKFLLFLVVHWLLEDKRIANYMTNVYRAAKSDNNQNPT